MLIKILLFLFIFFSISLFAKGEIQKIYAHYENAKPSSYTIRGHTYKWGQGKNIVIDGFEYNGHKYNYTGAYGDVIVKIRRVNNRYAKGTPCELFAVKHKNNNYQYESTFPQKNGKCDMATVMGGRIISVGALDLFRNTGSTAKNIERVDFITPNGIVAPTNSSDLEKAGHVVTEKSGNNAIKIAAILSLNKDGNPSSYGRLVGIHTGDQIDYGLTTIYFPNGSTSYKRKQGFLIDNKSGSQGYPYYWTTYSEALGMAFVSLKDLGIKAGQKYYGFSYFGRDVTNRMDLVNYNSFPKNTSGDTADPYGGVEGYFVDESILPPNGMILTAGNGDDYDKTNIYVFHIDVDTDKVTRFHQINKVNKKFRSLAYKDGKFYTVDNSNGDIYSIDINTGNLTRENSLGSIGVSNVVSMDFDDSEHILYTTCGICHGCVNNIKKFDISSQTTTIDTTLENEEAMGGLAWYGNNKYVVSVTSNMVRDIKNSTPQNNSDSQNYIEYGCGAEYVGNGKAYFISALEGNDDIFKYENNKITSIFHFRSLTNGDDAVAIAIKHKHNTPPPSKTFECSSESYISFNTSSWGPTYGDSKFDTINLSNGQLKNHKILNGVNGVNSIGYNIIDNYIWGYNLNSKKIVRIDADGNTKLYNRPSGLPQGFYIDADVDKNGILYLAENNTNTIYRVDVNPNSSTFLKALTPLKLKNNVKIYTADFAFNPKDGKLYYIDNHGKVYKIDTNTGIREFVVDSGLSNPRVIISFFDKDGNFYFNFNKDKLYKIDINNPKDAIFFTNLDKNLKNGDGARCPLATVNSSKINITPPKNISIAEGNNGYKSISIKLIADKTIPSDVSFSYSLSNGSAKKNQDYQSGGKLTFSKDTITIPNVIKGDKEAESDEYFYITLSSSDNRIEFINNKIKVNIINDDIRFVITDCPTMCKDTIGTKIVNKSFRINIFSINQNKDEVKNTIAKKVQIRIKNSSNQAITSWKNIDIYNKSRAYINLKSSKIDKNVKIELKWFNTETNTTEYQTSTDNFAIRPKKFKFTLPTTQIAGDQFRFKVEALDNNNRNVKGYNEHEGVSFTFSKKDKKSPTCKTGHITLSKYLNFQDGLFEDNSAKYDNVGVVDFKLAEKNDGSEFASVDRADTSNSDRLISPASTTITFIPKKFHINAVLNDVVGINPALKCPSEYPKKYITYYANNPLSMGANLDINISTTTANGDILTNYTDGCYSKDTNITVYYKNSNNIDNQSLISNKSFVSKDTYKFIISIDKSLFYNGKTDQNIKLNLSRNNKIVKNPSLFTIKSIKVNDDKTSSTLKLTSNNKAHFYYGRVHVSSPQETSQTYLDAKVYYEIYCKNCDKTIFTLANGSVSVDDVYWYILPKSIYSNFGSGVCDYHSPRATNGANPTHKDEATIHIIAPTIPHNDKIYYTPNQTYLRYNKFGTALPEHFFDVKFIFNTPVWAGRGKLGNTIDTNISKIPNRALEW